MLVNGYALYATRASQQMVTTVKNAKIALVDFNLHKFRMAIGVQVSCDNVEELANIRKREMDITKERIHKLINAGANVIITTKGIDDFAQKYLVDRGVMGIRRIAPKDIYKISKLTGASVMTTLATMEGDESFDPKDLGSAGEVSEEHIGDNDYIFIRNGKNTNAQSIFIRGCNEFMVDEIERSIHDSLCVVKRILESGAVVVGGGAVETALCV